jgi:glycosyltransferase involved in cell wall biosynthesis
LVAALDATPLTLSSGGLRRYTEELSRALALEFPDDRYHLISESGGFLHRRWWTAGVHFEMRRLHCEVFHGTNFSVPYLPLKPSVLTLHDVSPWLNPEWHHAADRVRSRTPYLLRLGLATIVITPTEAVRREAVDMFQLPVQKVCVVPEAASPHLRPQPGKRRKRPYFLFVGTIEPRKNVPVLVQALRTVRQHFDVDLVIAGRKRADAPALPQEPGLVLLGEVAEPGLAGLYSAAIACLYPSLYEGFGLPVIEAMQCGCPVITSRAAALLEVSGGAAIHVDATAVKAWSDAMISLLRNPAESHKRREMGFRRAGEFSWSRTARLTREVYAETIRRFSR